MRVSWSEIAPIQWAAVIVPAVMILLTIGLSPPCLLRLLPAGAVAGWDLHPLESAA